MKVIIVLCALATVALSAPQKGADADAVVVKSNIDNIGVDGYSWDFETSNGIKADEKGELTNAGSENEAISVRGSYSYLGPDGVTYTVTYVADENGFRPEGAHIPKRR